MSKTEEGNIDPLQNPDIAMIMELYADVAHEVRNLMQAVSGTIELEREAITDQFARNRFTKALSNCNLIGNLLTGLLKVMEDRGRAADAVNIIDDLVDLYKHNTKNKIPIQWLRGAPSYVAIPGLYVRLVLMNVIKNAIEATSACDSPGVRIQTKDNSDRIEIEIWNSGPQIHPKDIDSIFIRSFSTKHETGGSGIGLAVARRLVRESGGDLTVRNTNNGVAFTVTLVKDATRATASCPTPLSLIAVNGKRLKGRKVLVIDDDTSVREVLKLMIVELGGGNAELCASGNAAITQLQTTDDYDAILLDLRMKGITGKEVYEQLPDALQNRVIFISGDMNHSETVHFLREARRPALIKPLNARSLFDAIDSIPSVHRFQAGA